MAAERHVEEIDGARIAEILEAIPGSREAVRESLKQARRGETVPLSEL